MSENSDQSELQLLKGNSDVAFNLYKILAAEKEENVFFSPMSIHATLSMLCQGARGSTAQALLNTLQVTDAQSAGQGYKKILQGFHSLQDITMSLANKAVIKKELALQEKFKTALLDNFNSEVESLDFCDSPTAVEKINEWVKKQTHEKIQEIAKEDDFDESSGLVLYNAVYFHGGWRFEFFEGETLSEPFHVNKFEVIRVEMMHMGAVVPQCWSGILTADVIELPYGNTDLGMILILPDDVRDDLAGIEKNLSQAALDEIVQNLVRCTSVEVSLPRFKIEQTIDLRESLTALGIGEIFDESKVDLSGAVDEKHLCVGKIKQKASIEVNEKGSTAVADTENIPFRLSISQFTANRPFIFLIIRKAISATPIFVGKVVRPTA